MDYTDNILTNTTKVKAIHLTELASALTAISNASKVSVDTGLLISGKITSTNIKTIQAAINKLEASFSNNCCQANCCQTCEGCQSCQSNTCQSSSCQTCQSAKCQSCQSECNCNCDCNC